MWPLKGMGRGTHWFGGEGGMLDQFLASKHLLKSDAPVRVDTDSVEVIAFNGMAQGRYRPSRPFGDGRKHDPEGFSDHFPIGVRLVVRS